MNTYAEAVAELEADFTEAVQDVQRVHRLRVALAWAAVRAHVEANHEGCFYALPEGARCQDEDCLMASAVLIETDAYLAECRDLLDIDLHVHGPEVYGLTPDNTSVTVTPARMPANAAYDGGGGAENNRGEHAGS